MKNKIISKQWKDMELVPVNMDLLEDYNINEPYAHELQWVRENPVSENMKYSTSRDEQILFMRNTIAQELFLEKLKSLEVVSTHMSKSIVLPVYHIVLNDGTEFIIRNNFHDWKLTISSKQPLDLPMDLIHGNYLSPCYFEGFKENWVLPFYSKENNQNFSVEVRNRFKLYTLFYLIKTQLQERY